MCEPLLGGEATLMVEDEGHYKFPLQRKKACRVWEEPRSLLEPSPPEREEAPPATVGGLRDGQ